MQWSRQRKTPLRTTCTDSLLNEKTKGQRKKLARILEPYGITYQNVWNWLQGKEGSATASPD